MGFSSTENAALLNILELETGHSIQTFLCGFTGHRNGLFIIPTEGLICEYSHGSKLGASSKEVFCFNCRRLEPFHVEERALNHPQQVYRLRIVLWNP